MIAKVMQSQVAAGVVDWFASTEVDLFLRDDRKDFKPLPLKRFFYFKDIKVKRDQ